MQAKNRKAQLCQALLVLLLALMPCFYFFQKTHYIRDDIYTEHMTEVSAQVGELERETIWEDSKDQNKTSMMYTAYYYPQALTVVCRTTPVTYVRDTNSPPGAAFLISDEGTLYEARTVEDTDFNATLLIFEDVPSEFVHELHYLDIVPSQSVPEDGLYDPDSVNEDRIRYTLQGTDEA